MHYTQHHIGGIGLYRPNNAVGWIFASAIISLGLLKIANDRQVLITPTMKMIALVFIGLIIPYFYGQTDNLWKAADRFIAIAAGGLIVSDIANSFDEAVELALDTIHSGKAFDKLKNFVKNCGDIEKLEEVERS